ncbi:hypothetical protein [Agrococcus sp. BE272]|uniref:hypothetical protein n=1 Tax=Agrococcus sp. BE272 TaxID=2817727 RepID=UPI00286528F5|nr:hypothetical protein [Agrococcus sp. BE272]MDR7234302.1 hypothetical protein [Agrococcus sp. BE272]
MALAAPGVASAQGLEVGGSGNDYYLNDAFTAVANHEFELGLDSDRVYFGDWDGNGTDTAMVRRGAQYFPTQSNGAPSLGAGVTYGRSTDQVVVGDWDGDGRDSLAIRRGTQFHISNTISSGSAERVVTYGRDGDVVLVGDWDGNGTDTFAVRRGAQYHIRNSLTSGFADEVVQYGRASDAVLVGDWDGDGDDTFAVRRGATYYVANTIRSGAADITFTYGRSSDIAFAGDWDGDGEHTLGVRRSDSAAAAQPAPAPAPSTGMPGPDNTGVPAGVSLRVHRGDIVVTQPGTVLSGLDIHGYVDVRAADVTIRNSIIRGGAAGGQDALVRSATAGASLTIVDSELVAANPNPGIDGLRGWNIDAARLDIHGVIDPAHFWGSGNVQLRDSWLHDTLHYENDPGWNGGPSHDDGIQIQGGSGYWITGNRIEDAVNTAIMITQDQGTVSNVAISGNFLDHGACTVNLAQKDRGAFQNIDIVDNVFGSNSRYNCQVIRPTSGDISIGDNTTVSGAAPRINFH